MIYYVEDDANIRDMAIYALKSQGMEVRGFADGCSFRDACEHEMPELVLLDIMLPDEDGLSILAWIRGASSMPAVPVMMLTAKGTEYDKVTGLDLGADDYLAKPFGVMELVSRCRALLRRSVFRDANMAPDAGHAISIGHIWLSNAEHRVLVDGIELKLTLKEFDMLRKFMESPGRAFSRAQLLEDVWSVAYAGETRTVDTHVQTLRRKLNEASPGAGDAIQTVRGVGYRFAGLQ